MRIPGFRTRQSFIEVRELLTDLEFKLCFIDSSPSQSNLLCKEMETGDENCVSYTWCCISVCWKPYFARERYKHSKKYAHLSGLMMVNLLLPLHIMLWTLGTLPKCQLNIPEGYTCRQINEALCVYHPDLLSWLILYPLLSLVCIRVELPYVLPLSVSVECCCTCRKIWYNFILRWVSVGYSATPLAPLWCHPIDDFSALLATCAMAGGFPSLSPSNSDFDVPSMWVHISC